MAERPTRKPSAPASGRNTSVDPALPHKKRARRRVIGAAAMLLGAAIVLPLILESEPRQPTPDLVMKIPPRDPAPAGSAAPAQEEAGAARDEDRAAAPLAPSITEPVGGAVAADASGRGGEPRTGDARASGAAAGSTGTKGADAKPAPTKPDARGDAKADKAADAKGSAAKAADSRAADSRAADSKAADVKAADVKAADVKAADVKAAEAKPADPRVSDAYWVQVGAYRSDDAASRAADSARAAGLAPRTEKLAGSGGKVTRVRIGPFRDREAAARARDQLKARGVEAAIIAP